jgi:hypothetical protein
MLYFTGLCRLKETGATMNLDNVKELRTWFSGYCRSFHSSDSEFNRNIMLEEEHALQVCENCDRISIEESLNKDAMLLAEVIALLHDIGRFEQYHQYATFVDSVSVNHAELGAMIIEESDVLAPLFPHERSVATRVIEMHNVFQVPEDLPQDTKFLLRLLRDADKLHIWHFYIELFKRPEGIRSASTRLGLPDGSTCSPGVVDRILNGEMVNRSRVKSLYDFKLMLLSWVYDLNFPASFRILAERDCISGVCETLRDDERVGDAVRLVRDFAGKH